MSGVANEFQTEEPSCKPLDTYEEILAFLEDPPSWRSLCKEMTPHSSDKIRNMSLNSMASPIALDRAPTFCHFSPDQEDVEREPASELPKTLVCHDMANGYHDDSKIDGTSNHTAYTFYHWAGIDIFCYFSHHLVTIPPVGWINTGHAHGVKVIGTVITEWMEGVDFWEYVLEEEARYQQLASALVTIAQTLKFDGWLLNVENKVSKPLVLLQFVQCLHRRLHEVLPHAELIWYDSVTIKGNLNWQNGLNHFNKDFFDACDGFFTNYSWKEEDIASSVQAAGERLTDLYVGIDVWGRNFYGGGQFNTAVAVELASSHGCSLAIFAPAWTHEAAARRDAAVALAAAPGALHALQLRERALWGSLWLFLATRLPCALPFQTSFCRGHGAKRRLYGEVMSPGPWYNLRHMQYQPNSTYGPHGYRLATPEEIAQVSTHGITRDKTKGIIKYHSAFEASRHELHTVRSPRQLSEGQGPSAAAHNEERHNEEHHHSMKDAFKQLFNYKLRSRRRSLDSHDGHAHDGHAHDEHAHDEHAHDEHPRHDIREGWSMRQLSVNIRLGQGAKPKPRLELACVPGELPCLEPYFDDSYTGGSCLRVHPSDAACAERRWARLLHCDFASDGELVVCVVTKAAPGHAAQWLDVKLFARDAAGNEERVTCVGREVPGVAPGRVASAAPRLQLQHALTLYPLRPGRALSNLQKYLLLNQPGFYQSIENSFGWKVRYYVVPLGAARVTSVNVLCGLGEGPILLGHIGICHLYEEEEEIYTLEDEGSRTARDTQAQSQSQEVHKHQCLTCTAKLLGPAGARPPRKVQYDAHDRGSVPQREGPSFHAASGLSLNDIDLSPLGSFESESLSSTLTESKLSLSTLASALDSRTSAISDVTKTPVDSRPSIVSDRPESPRNVKTLENSDVPDRANSPRGSECPSPRSRSPSDRRSDESSDRPKSPHSCKH